MNRNSIKKKLLLPMFLLVIIQIAVFAGMFDRLELMFYDSWFKLRGIENPGDDIVIVAMDDQSYRKIGNPWPRTAHADLLKLLSEAKIVAFDLTFTSERSPEEDATFAEAIKNHGKVLHASNFSFERNENGDQEQVLEMPIDKFWDGSLGVGFVNTPTDIDQVVRRVSLVDVNTFDIPFPSFATAIFMAAKGLEPTQINVSNGVLKIGNQAIPIDNLNRAMPNFWGPKATFNTVSYVDVLNGKVPPSTFKDKIVLVGSTTALDQDNYPTPHSTSNMVLTGALPTPGVEIHASTVQSLLSDTWYQKVSPIGNMAFLFVVCILTSFAVANRSPWIGLLGATAVILVAFGLSYILWQAGWWLNIAAPATLIILTYVVTTAADFIQAEIARRRTKAMFSRYLSPDVVESLIREEKEVSLGGTRKTVTIMFCDIRGFTAYSEGKSPEEVVCRLNEYLTAITHIIFKYGGTLDKYLGDGLMAIFGAPISFDDHIEKAIKAAIEIQQAVDELNTKWSQQGAPPLFIGVGINSGSVLVGNVGSPERMDYTVIGEDVNLASRVEGLTKHFGKLIIISERSEQIVADGQLKQSLVYLGSAEVKGFSVPIGCYTVEDR